MAVSGVIVNGNLWVVLKIYTGDAGASEVVCNPTTHNNTHLGCQ